MSGALRPAGFGFLTSSADWEISGAPLRVLDLFLGGDLNKDESTFLVRSNYPSDSFGVIGWDSILYLC
jgi:hypothetical protein